MSVKEHIDWNALAEGVLEGRGILRDEALAVLGSADEEILEVMNAAYRVRRHHLGNRVRIHLLRNAKSGLCPEDCAFCSQSIYARTEIERYKMQSPDELVEGGLEAFAAGAVTYCMVTSTRWPSKSDLDAVCEAARRIKSEHPQLRLCASLGMLKAGQAEQLAAAGVNRYNHNLETSERFFPQICGTHSYQDRVDTVRMAKAAGLEACCGALLGMGESPEDRVDLGLALRELDVQSIPVNFLNARPGTPLEGRPQLAPYDCLRALAMFRLMHPDRDVRIAGGREVCLGQLQPLALYAANSFFTNGYLTTPGQGKSKDLEMVEQAGFIPEVIPD